MPSIQAKLASRVSALGDRVGDARDQLGLGSSSRPRSHVSDLFPDEKPAKSAVNDLFPDEKPVKAVPAPLPPLAVPTPTPLRSATAPPVATMSWQQATPFESRPQIAEDAPPVAAVPSDTRWDPRWDPPDPTVLLAGELVQGRPLDATRYDGRVSPGQEGDTKPPPGRVYVTNHRLLWAATAPAAAPTASVRLLSIERVRSHRDERAGDHCLLVDVYQKYDALPSLRLTMADAEAHRMAAYIKRHQAARASLDASFAVAHGAALGAELRRGGGWGLYADEDEFQRMGLNNPLSHWRVCRSSPS